MKFSNVTEVAQHLAKWTAENPKSATMYGIAGTAIIVPGAFSAPALGVIGFGANVMPGSIAAGAQAGIGNVAAGSLFATLQSAGAHGYGAAIVNAAVQAGGAATAGATFLRARCSSDVDLEIIDKILAWIKQEIYKSDGHVKDVADLQQFKYAAEQAWIGIPIDDNLKQFTDDYSQRQAEVSKTGF
ncbi:hypothetical protein F4804DRAFT_327962 [Jackrogersella minutella]|nr:hypothetical protein F4804DRAFT_327962 [Jackrogersella minutella]